MHWTRARFVFPALASLLAATVTGCGGSTSADPKGPDASAAGGSFGAGGVVGAGGALGTGGAASTSSPSGGATGGGSPDAAVGAGGTAGTGGGIRASGGAPGAGGTKSAGGATGGTPTTGGTTGAGGAKPSGGATGGGGVRATGGTLTTGGTTGAGGSRADGGATGRGGAGSGGVAGAGGTPTTGGTTGAGGAPASGGSVAAGGTTGAGGGTTGEAWPNIRVVGNRLCDRWGKPFAVRSIESMFGNGTSNATAFVAGHKALGANAMGPLPNSSVSNAEDIEALLDAAYDAGLVMGLNADHTNQGERFFRSAEIQAIVNRYPNVFLQEAVELGSEMTAAEWVRAAKDKVDAYVGLYPDKPLKIGSPMGGRSPRFALDHCEEVVEYYYAQGGRGGLIFTCQLYWKAATSSWSYQEENGFDDGLPGILQAVDAMAASPCMFMPGLDNEDDVGYTGWREVMDHVRASHAEPGRRLSYQWWVYYNSGDPYDNDLTTNAGNALAGITSTGTDVKAKLEADRTYVELGPLNP